MKKGREHSLEEWRICIVTLNTTECQKKIKGREGLHWKENDTIPGLDVDVMYLTCFIMVR